MNIPTAIKQFRKEKGLSQQQVADAVKMNRVQYTRIETGKADLTITTLQKIAKVLGVQVIDFFNESATDVNSFDKNIMEKVKLIEQLDEPQQKSLFNFVDTVVANKRLKDTLSNALSVAQ